MMYNARCDPAEVARLEQEMARTQTGMGVGVIDTRSGEIRLFTYDETDAFSMANPHLQVMAGHEAAATMGGVPLDQARGFVLAKQGSDWVLVNSSHLNSADGQSNVLRMNPQTFNEVIAALQAAGVHNPMIQ
jgi:hypothetical protein